MPRKGMRSVFFRSSTTVLPPSSPTSSPQSGSTSSVMRSLHHRTRFSPPVFSFSESMLEKTLSVAEEMIGKWNLENDKFSKAIYLFQEETRTEAKEFIKCIRDLQRAMNFLLYETANSQKLIQAQGLMQVGMKRLEKEFYHILSANRDHLDPELISGRTSRASKSTTRSTPTRMSASSAMGFSEFEDEAGSDDDDIQVAENSISKVAEASSFAMVDIKMIADCMISCGYGKECIKIYKIIRKSIVDEGLYRLGIVHIKSHLIKKMDWEVLELKIKTWLEAVKIGVRTLFFAERVLCDYVFANSDAMRESCFSGICKDGGRILFGFPKKVAKMKKPAPEKVFLMLDLYSAIANLWAEIESIFSFESTSAVRSKAVGSLTRLGDAVRAMISEFESAVQKDNSKLQIHGGSVHPLTRYATNFIVLLADYENPLFDIVADWPLPVQAPLAESYSPKYDNSDDTPPSPLRARFGWLILVLLCKIDTKVEYCKDVALSYLFLANNLNFVVSKVRTSNLRMILSDKWLAKHEKKVKKYVSNYEKIGWTKVVSALPDNPNDEITPDEVKFRVKRFNAAFETTYRTQSSWVVSDSKLRDDIEVLLCKKIVPVYTEFYERYREIDIDSHFKYRPDELTSYISGLFYEKRGLSHSSSHASSGPGQLQRCGTM